MQRSAKGDVWLSLAACAGICFRWGGRARRFRTADALVAARAAEGAGAVRRRRTGPNDRAVSLLAIAATAWRPTACAVSLLAVAGTAFLPTACDAAPDAKANAKTEATPDAGPLRLDGRVVGVGDGDSLTLLVDRERIRIRLAQIDAPELGQPYGKRAKAALSALAFGKRARVEVVDIDRYGRTVGEVFVDGIDLNREMVREGHAWAYTQYAHSTEIIALEDAARAAEKGLWSLPESQREPPWIWRHRNR